MKSRKMASMLMGSTIMQVKEALGEGSSVKSHAD
jgi:hypothetical protein